MYIYLVTFEEHFSWSGELNVESVIKTLHKFSCITDGKKGNMNENVGSVLFYEIDKVLGFIIDEEFRY
jgi:hypothetical protein